MFTVKAHAKLNWSLDLLGTRPNGYHELDMLMQHIELADELTFENARWTMLTIDGQALPVGERNLIVRAVNALNDYMGTRRGARIQLKKRIPVRAGLGGGSADCAATLLALNRLWKLRLSTEKLCEIGAKLGADVPFCIRGGLCRVSGIGEIIEPLACGPRIPMVLLHPGGGLSTQAVFGKFDEGRYPSLHVDTAAVARAVQAGDVAAYDACSGNALEAPAIALMEEVRTAMVQLRQAGAGAVRMSGSGSAVFGLFDADEQARQAAEKLPGAILSASLCE
ncbi:MAG: 4-(cytidine 5'-diphospho)-2-C-methyl-D-erythritol kinase [Clostridia bacterium]|nr:4-(cytidine 5'-diphospho)-2-C-methyl-D-erythritol kinase [Clostridia bacterium]